MKGMPFVASSSPATARRTWWQNSVVYQIYPRSFADSNGDGIGDLRGIIGRLDHLVALGVEIIWLSPIYPSPQDDNGYDISDYQNVDPIFGTLDDFDELLGACHTRGIRLIMDLVVNHTSDEHPWFLESRDPASPKRDWYHWLPPRPGFEPGTDAAAPSNWGSRFSGSAWQYDERSAEYYLHIFSRKQPDLNWENPEVREAVYTMMRWWLDRGVDGFRMDVINFISKVPGFPDAPVPEHAIYGQARALYINGPRIHEFLKEMHRDVLADYADRIVTVGETPRVTVEDGRMFTSADRQELDMLFQFDHMDMDAGINKWDPKPLDLVDLKRIFGSWQTGLADEGWNSLYWNNHDQPRIVSRWGDPDEFHTASATLFGTLLHFHRGTPYIYQGEELGMTNAPFDSIDDFRDIQSLNHFREATEHLGQDPASVLAALRTRSRDNGRTPMQWSAEMNGGWSSDPWIAVNRNHTEINAAAQVGIDGSVFEHYRRLVDLRRSEPLLVDGRFEMLVPEDPALYAFTRTDGGRGLLVLANVSGSPLAVPASVLAGREDWALLIGNLHDSASAARDATSLRPWEAVVYIGAL